MRRLGVGVAVVLSVAACTPVNEEAGKPVGHAFQLLKYPTAQLDPAAEPQGRSPFGDYALEVSGSVTYLGETTELPGAGVMTVGPGPRRGELKIEQYYRGDRFPYETGVVSAGEGKPSTLDAITIVNPLDSRVTLQCAVDGGIALADIEGERELTGTCGGGSKAHGHVRAEGSRKATWRDKPVELVRTVVDLTVTGASSGEIHQVNEVPKDSAVASFPLYTSIDVNMTAQGISLTQKLQRHVLPKVKD
ncbi:hypothetical protein [Mycobacteroides abscessus]|uniref:Lipoprotein n=1 Tax=Mycobacteroides abscessus subsp. massiliense TaxID=1962118 RepID=A0A1T8S1N9_9MYCO|nr:hypothetical protein [Mycobacteroides abscessus]AMU65326.1 hypothetical protein A3O04_08585 [Mycobacteroides abscessus]ANO13893.1 hypothetical protein BAB77_08540 [Mycobacteroides abscessus]ARQ64151.1 hypothetical protein CAK77_08600 [Mycobacteroides abscessus subsp. massiliense]EHM20330.1 hypothetical protein MMAS_16160 [Mycobacteroides abscessus subsp. massiliense CCUG 48898 = JCM 15300]EIV68182.1 hypothetical protein MMCCUG48898_1525 [Mycobacteroides abscessus subsp. massiliense CCUG 488